jgi:hypothetical protein
MTCAVAVVLHGVGDFNLDQKADLGCYYFNSTGPPEPHLPGMGVGTGSGWNVHCLKIHLLSDLCFP